MTLKISSAVFLLACLTTLTAQPRPAAHAGHAYPGRSGLTLVALGHDGFALAADGAQYNADGTISQTQKIFPVGKSGAVLFAGKSSEQDPVERKVREEFNPERIAVPWLSAHPDVSIDVASRELGRLISEAANSHFPKRASTKEAGKYKFAAVFAGYVDGKIFLAGTRYFMPPASGKLMRSEALAGGLKPGEVWAFGLVKVQQELMSGRSVALKKFKEEPAVKKLRSAEPEQLSAHDYADAFITILQVAESPEGRKFDPGPALIGGPNRFATVTAKEGFSWSGK